MSKKSFTFSGRVAREEAISYLEELVNGLRSGTFRIKGREEYVSVSPREELEIEVKATSKKSKEKVAVQLSWKTEAPDDERARDEQTGA